MIHSTRHIVTPVAIVVFCCFVFLDLKSGHGHKDGRTDNMCENTYPYLPWLWVGRVDQQGYKYSWKAADDKTCLQKVPQVAITILTWNWSIGWPTVPASGESYFHTCFRASVRPHFSKYYKTNVAWNNDRYWCDCGSGQGAHWCHMSCLFYFPRFWKVRWTNKHTDESMDGCKKGRTTLR